MSLFNQIDEKVLGAYRGSKSDYINLAGSWYEDQYAQLLHSRNRCLAFGSVMTVLLALALIALILLMPLKRVDKVFVAIDKSVGEPVVIRPLTDDSFPSNQALSRHMLTQFLSVRESFNPQTIEDDVNAVRVLSTPDVYQQDKDYLAKNNPDSPFNLLKSGTRSIKVDRIILIKANQAIVFFTETDNVNQVITVHQVSADIDFRYTSLALTNSEAENINPVGFQVTGYRVQTATLLGGVDHEVVANNSSHA